MIRINLLGRDAEEQSKGGGFRMPELGINATQVGIGFMLGIVLLGIAGAWWYQSGRLALVRAELNAVEAERRQLEEVAEQVEQLQSQTDLLRDKLGVIVELKASQTGPVMLLDQISRMLSDGVWLDRLELNESDVDVRGSALSDVSVADFVNNLEGSPFFVDVRLRTMVESGEELDFQITFLFDPTPGSEPVVADGFDPADRRDS